MCRPPQFARQTRISRPLKLHCCVLLESARLTLNSINEFANSVALLTIDSVVLPGATIFIENLQQIHRNEETDNDLNLLGAFSNLSHCKDARADGKKPTNGSWRLQLHV
jgi:hypothetical protein